MRIVSPKYIFPIAQPTLSHILTIISLMSVWTFLTTDKKCANLFERRSFRSSHQTVLIHRLLGILHADGRLYTFDTSPVCGEHRFLRFFQEIPPSKKRLHVSLTLEKELARDAANKA